MTRYIVQQGDCISSIAHRFGFSWESLWNDATNADLRKRRESPNILFPGDVVIIPERQEPAFAAAVDRWNHFVIDRGTATVRLRLRINGRPIANIAYTMETDGSSISGVTDGDGNLVASVPPEAQSAFLRVAGSFSCRLKLGALDPLSTPTGIQSRLASLGFYSGAIDGILGTLSRAAIRFFQASVELPPTGDADAETLAALRTKFGC